MTKHLDLAREAKAEFLGSMPASYMDQALDVRAFAEAIGQPPPPLVSAGVCRAGKKFGLMAFAMTPEQAHYAKSRAPKGIPFEVRVMPGIHARITREFAQQKQRPLIIGQQIRPHGAPWVGTGGLYVPSADRRACLQVTNSHVVGLRAQAGTPMTQGGEVYGYVYRNNGIVIGGVQEVDVASVAVIQGLEGYFDWESGIDDVLAGIESVTPDDLDQGFTNTGQTRGTMFGNCIAIEIDGQPIGYDEGHAWLNNLSAYAKPGVGEFSVAGHSGSTIVRVSDRKAKSLLFAGGPDSNGDDITFGCDLPKAILAAGGLVEVFR